MPSPADSRLTWLEFPPDLDPVTWAEQASLTRPSVQLPECHSRLVHLLGCSEVFSPRNRYKSCGYIAWSLYDPAGLGAVPSYYQDNPLGISLIFQIPTTRLAALFPGQIAQSS
jgi:hypothetical protein